LLRRTAALVVVLALSGCATSRPGWVASPPELPGYAAVVGVATGKTSREEARQAAQAAAVSKLTARFGFTAQLSYQETNSLLEGRQVEEKLETAGPRVRLPEAPELVARHEERGEDGRWDVYVLVRYPLAAIKREQERLAQAEEGGRLAAVVALGRARAALAEGAVGQALLLLGDAQSREANPVVRQQAAAELHRVASALRLEPLPGAAPYATLAGLAEPLRLRASLEGRAAEGVRVCFRFLGAAGELDPVARTDAQGVACCRVGALTAAPLYIVAAEAQLPPLQGQPLGGARAEFRFRLKPVPWRVALDITEENLGISQPESVVAAALAEQLSAAGVALAVAGEEAEVQVSGRATTLEGSDTLGWEYAAVADVRLKAVLVKEGRVLAEKQVSLADFSDSVEQAGVRALRQAAASAARAILEGLLVASP
jgi:hypothetical protein